WENKKNKRFSHSATLQSIVLLAGNSVNLDLSKVRISPSVPITATEPVAICVPFHQYFFLTTCIY
ncbi:MAG: hypothetical protein ACLFR1_08835, partial [Spirochaetia bacterium]